ncbi:hypothetical protein FACS1894137_17990 [Spirochaetia bacterium]|nr:hypothetical protein FACS1894137_17990 [Spirochaetia bacterium]
MFDQFQEVVINPNFSRDYLTRQLKDNDIKYVFLGDNCGARINDPTCYIDGRVSYDKIKETTVFKQGLERILNGLNKYSISLLCAEKDPISCHRDILVCRNLKTYNLNIQHIISENVLEPNLKAENRLLKQFKLDINDIFMSDEERLNLAYDKQGNKIAYNLQREEV